MWRRVESGSRRTCSSGLNPAADSIARNVSRPSYDEIVQKQLVDAKAQATASPEDMLSSLLGSGDTWTIL